jgi:hypothetical protein
MKYADHILTTCGIFNSKRRSETRVEAKALLYGAPFLYSAVR